MARADGDRIGQRHLGLVRGDVAIFQHAADHIIAAIVEALRIAAGSFRQRGQESRLGHGQLVETLVEIVQRGGGDAIGAAEEDLVEIELEDMILGEGLLDAEGEDRLLDLARHGPLGR